MAARIRGRDDLVRWLAGRSRAEAIVIAARAAARALPLIVTGASENRTQLLADLTLATFRANALARAAGEYPALANELFAATAARAAITARMADIGDHPAERTAAAAARAAYAAGATNAAAASAEAVATARAAAAAVVAAARSAAAASLIWKEVEADARYLEANGFAPLLAARIWQDGAPPWVAEHWDALKRRLRPKEGWSVWTNWYEALLAGREPYPDLDSKTREDLEIQICLINEEIWDEGPAVANAEIARLIAEATVPVVPPQGPGPHFELDGTNRIAPQPHFEFDGAAPTPKRIRSLLPLARRAADDLMQALPTNDPHKLHRDARDYRATIDAEPERIDWIAVYGFGLFIENAAVAADRDIADRTIPPLEDPAKKALDTLRGLHASLISESDEARILSDDDDAKALPRAEQQALGADVERMAERLEAAPEVAASETAETLKRAAEAMGQGPQPEKGTAYGLATLGNLTIVLVSAAAVASLGASLGGAEGTAAQWTALEGLKKTPMFTNVAEALGASFKDALNASGQTLYWKAAALAPFRDYVIANEELVRRFIASLKRFRWASRYVDFIVRTDIRKSAQAPSEL